MTIIARVELKFPDDEDKKNSICKPMDVPQIPQEFFTSARTNNEVQAAAIKALGFTTVFNFSCKTSTYLVLAGPIWATFTEWGDALLCDARKSLKHVAMTSTETMPFTLS